MPPDEVLKRGHHVIAVTRTPLSLPTNNLLENRIGDVTSASFDAEAIQGCDKIISCIGQRRKSPLSKSSSPDDILSSVMRAVVNAIGSDSSRQVVYLSAFGVGEDLKKHSIIFRAVLKLFSIGNAYKDHAEAERLLKSSRVSWTIVRPVGLTEKSNGKPAVEGNIARLLSAWRKSDRPVLHATSLANPGIGFRTGRSWQPNQGGSRSNR